jgi:hypothetical protein
MSIWDKLNPPPRVRRWAYGVSAAGLAVLAVYGVLDDEQLVVWSLLGSALLGVAAGNTPSSGDDA